MEERLDSINVSELVQINVSDQLNVKRQREGTVKDDTECSGLEDCNG